MTTVQSPFDAPARPAVTGWSVAAIFALAVALAGLPIVLHPLPPLTDYVNHLARMHVIASVGSDPDLARFYELDWRVVPNLMMDLVVPALHRLTGVYVAGQVFLLGTFAITLSGTLVLHRALFGAWSPVPLVASVLLYNSVFLVGVMDYLFGVGLAIWALAAWIALRERPAVARLGVSLVAVLALFFCHLYTAGLYGMGLLAFELHRLVTRRDRPGWARLADFAATGLPFLPLGALMLHSPTLALAADNTWEASGKIAGLVGVIEVYSDVVALLIVGAVTAAAAYAGRRGLLRFHPIGIGLLLVGCAVYLAMPRVLFGTYMADQRLPVALAFMVAACVHVEMRQRAVRAAVALMVLALIGLRVGEVTTAWSGLGEGIEAFRESVKRIDRGATVLVVYADASGGDEIDDYYLVHAACLAMIERSALVTTAFTVPGKQILVPRGDYRARVDINDGTPPTIDQLLTGSTALSGNSSAYWSDWQEDFDYVYVLFTEPSSPNPAPDRLTLVHDDARFQLYRVTRPFQMDAALAPS